MSMSGCRTMSSGLLVSGSCAPTIARARLTSRTARDLFLIATEHLEGAASNRAQPEQADFDGFHEPVSWPAPRGAGVDRITRLRVRPHAAPAGRPCEAFP